ncbi:tetratricopeptide repeat protein [Caldisalinibacter kiritimatiensis]|uniref:Xre family DNA-binding domain and TPR repeats containing protein n=1 Tax=Caldisalinibacter kiritimatiensis TaxID=1304284 RepID=R1CSA4_9FIRM|nr:tetratricopeptide repeat protein [Caldisalinibacter kiritimatiensis]EOC99583.1 Xre family DNA-binding domain and TPR repeats containing protein [Caldisalinibacter kiritimatiensis]
MYILEENILPVPEKIKSIRKYLGLKQEELTDGQISRSLISYIENGKVKLTKTVAETIAKCIKEVLINKDIHLDIDADYLMSDEIKQANIAIEKYLTKLNKAVKENDEELIKEIIKKEKIWSKWDVPEKQAVIYELIGDYYYNNMKFRDGYMYYIKAHECNIKIDNNYKSAEVVTKIARCSLLLKDYEDSIKLNKHALAILEKSNIESENLYKRCLFNIAIAYKDLRNHEKVLEYLYKIENSGYQLSDSQSIDIFILKGNSYYGNGDYNEAEIYYKKAIELAEKKKDRERLSLVYMNISALYNKIGKVEKTINFGKKALENMKGINVKGREEKMLMIARGYKSLEEYDLAEKYLLRALKETDYTSDLNVKIEIYLELLTLYQSTNEHYLIMRLIEEVEELYKDNDISKYKREARKLERFLIISIYHLIDKDIEKSKELLKLLIKKGDDYEN